MMQSSLRRAVHGFGLSALLGLLGACAVNPTVPRQATLSSNEAQFAVRQQLRQGDWLVIRGVHYTDDFIATLTNSPLSHAAIYDAQRDEVIEAEGQGIHATPLADFLAKSYRVLIIRPIWATPANVDQAVARARGWIGQGYNFSGLIGIDTPDRLYCTQLILNAYQPFQTAKPNNPIPKIIEPGQIYHWGTIVYESGPQA